VNAHGKLGLSADQAALLFDKLDVHKRGALSKVDVDEASEKGLLGGLLSGAGFLGAVGVPSLPTLPAGLPSLW
jgi:hypothetical protein